MLSSKNRLKKEDFKTLKDFKKKIFNSKNFTLKLYYTGFNSTRFSIIVPVKFSKKAVDRNKIRRQIKGIIFSFLKDIESGFGVIFYVKKEAKDIVFEELKKEITTLLKKSNILN